MADYSPPLLSNEAANLEEEIRQLTDKHNRLVESIAQLWIEIQRTSPDTLTKQLCQRRIQELDSLIHSVDHPPQAPRTNQDAWD